MLKKENAIIIVLFVFFLSSTSWAIPPMPARIGGTLTVTSSQLVKPTGMGPGSVPTVVSKQITQEDDDEYTFAVTREDGVGYIPAAEDTDGLGDTDTYIIDIPIYEKDDQPEGAIPGDIAVVHVYKNGVEMEIISPPRGRLIVGNESSRAHIDLVVKNNGPGDELVYTQEQLDMAIEEAVNFAVRKWDINSDGKVGIEEAINALRVISGF